MGCKIGTKRPILHVKKGQMSAAEGKKALELYMASAGRFGGGPLLVPLYGGGELPQVGRLGAGLAQGAHSWDERIQRTGAP
jgi:RAB protein geranylgeranyltransferase component A